MKSAIPRLPDNLNEFPPETLFHYGTDDYFGFLFGKFVSHVQNVISVMDSYNADNDYEKRKINKGDILFCVVSKQFYFVQEIRHTEDDYSRYFAHCAPVTVEETDGTQTEKRFDMNADAVSLSLYKFARKLGYALTSYELADHIQVVLDNVQF